MEPKVPKRAVGRKRARKRAAVKRTPIGRKKVEDLQGKVVVLQTRFRTFIGTIVEVRRACVVLRVFSRAGRVFITIRIPLRSIRRLIPFPSS
ncbi:hypothetical protein [Heliorestis convoluta]|uniref:hypothetical protein n=1 Tax=Heliorestis convoluta TaxID=356322 RepID=UPI00129A19AA|nr:hypothetical protein [Heliorestis convoluta]